MRHLLLLALLLIPNEHLQAMQEYGTLSQYEDPSLSPDDCSRGIDESNQESCNNQGD